MKFPWPFVQAHESVQANFDQLASALPNTPLMLTFPQLAVGGARKIAFGTGVLTYPGASTASNNTTVAHGLGLVPVMAVATTQNASTFFDHPMITFDATNVIVKGKTTDGTSPGAGTTKTFYWIAIG